MYAMLLLISFCSRRTVAMCIRTPSKVTSAWTKPKALT